MKLLRGEKVPIKIWAEEIEEGALKQAKNLANLPFAYKWIALMPDVHQGFGMPIGGVLAAKDVVIPNAVGVDIGCGVRAMRTNLTVEALMPEREKVLKYVMKEVPVGFKHHKKPQQHPVLNMYNEVTGVVKEQWESARCQLGTLGGGNHFIELQRDEKGRVWIMVHSGSRNLGKQVADHYNKLAKELNKKQHSPVPPEYQLAYLSLESKEGKNYWADMTFCIKFAEANRELIMKQVVQALSKYFPHFDPQEEYDVRHNYASVENHYGEKVAVHRKGAVRAEGTVIIPGSMGTPSYICEGLMNPESFCSCSHGAGRKMSRSKAKKEISIQSVMQEMDRKDIKLVKPKKSDVAEECAEAYKDIDKVMDEQKDLVRIKLKLYPLGVIKA